MNVSIKEIKGNWMKGYALDKHKIRSVYTGDNEYGHPTFDTTRTEVGEAVYKLKYRNDTNQIQGLADAVVQNLLPKFDNVSLIIPAPASKRRSIQPVHEIAKAIGHKIKVKSFENIVVKSQSTSSTVELKDMTTKEEKETALVDRFTINDEITNEGCWNALVLDDLFDTGATMEAVCRSLRTYRKIDKIYVAALTWK